MISGARDGAAGRATDEFTAVCQTCGQRKQVCCGSHVNGFWCHDCCPHPYDHDDDYPYDDEDNEPDDPYENFDCHMDSRGSCGKAGSEECEFECPYRRTIR